MDISILDSIVDIHPLVVDFFLVRQEVFLFDRLLERDVVVGSTSFGCFKSIRCVQCDHSVFVFDALRCENVLQQSAFDCLGNAFPDILAFCLSDIVAGFVLQVLDIVDTHLDVAAFKPLNCEVCRFLRLGAASTGCNRNLCYVCE